MKTPALFLAFLAALILPLAPVRAQAPCWRGIPFGTSKVDVQQLLPGGTWTGDIYLFETFELFTGHPVDAHQWQWKLMLQFADNRFERAILLHHVPGKLRTLIYETMDWRTTLAKVYGAPILDDADKDKRTTVWRKGPLCVSLDWLQRCAPDETTVTLVYEGLPEGL